MNFSTTRYNKLYKHSIVRNLLKAIWEIVDSILQLTKLKNPSFEIIQYLHA